MSSDQIDPANLAADDSVDWPSESEVLQRLEHLWSDQSPRSTSAWIDKTTQRIGRFEIRGVLGQGGMGRVYLAVDSELGREVAIKVPIFDPSGNPAALERFRREGRAAGALSHANVVSVLEVGETEHGCFLVCQYVNGSTLRDFLRDNGRVRDAPTAAKLMLAIARGVQAAHSQGVIHRDLKPSNVLLEQLSRDASTGLTDTSVVSIDGRLVRPRVTDFGLAGFIENHTAITASGTLLGSPSYMAPEQIAGTSLGPPADTFSLGVILYELLQGTAPFAGESYVSTIDRIQNFDPPALTTSNPSIPRDLAAICECAIAKEPNQRYSNAGELADDLQRFLDESPVRARSLSRIGRIHRWIRRHPVHTTLIVVVCTGLMWTLFQNRRLESALNRAAMLRNEMTANATELEETNAAYRERVYVQDMILAFDAFDQRAIDDVRSLLNRQLPVDGQRDLRGIEWFALANEIETAPPVEIRASDAAIYDIAVTPDGKHFFTVGKDRTRRYWDLETKQPIRISQPDLTGPLHAIAISPDGSTFFSGVNMLLPYRASDGSLAESEPITHHKFGIRAIAVSPDNRLIASLCLQHQIHLHSLDPDRPYSNTEVGIPSQRCTRVGFSVDSKHLYFSKQCFPRGKRRPTPDEFVVFDIETGTEIFSKPPLTSVRFGPVDGTENGSEVAIGGHSHIQLFDVAANEFSEMIETARGMTLDVEYSPGDRYIAHAGTDGTLYVSESAATNLPDGSPSVIYQSREHQDPINTVAWVDDNRILTGDDAGRVMLHRIDQRIDSLATYENANRCLVDQIDQRAVVLDRSREARVIDLKTNAVIARCGNVLSGYPHHAVLDPSGQWLVLVRLGDIQVWNLQTESMQYSREHRLTADSDQPDHPVASIAIAPDGKQFATLGTTDATIILWDTATGEQLTAFVLHPDSLGSVVTYSPDGEILVRWRIQWCDRL